MSHDPEMADTPPAENVVSLVGLLERQHKPLICRHEHVILDDANRIVTCSDCNREIDPFQALCHLAESTSKWQRDSEVMRKDYKNLAGYVPIMRAVRTLEGMWRSKRLPMCPHCKEGVSAEGLARMEWVHQAHAEAVAAWKAETSPSASITRLHPEPRG